MITTRYRIQSICDVFGHPKRDEASLNRIGRIVIQETSSIKIGKRGYLFCANGSDILTSTVNCIYYGGGYVIIRTENSVYELKFMKRESVGNTNRKINRKTPAKEWCV